MAALLRAIRTLISKNLRYLVLRRFLLVLITAFIFPITVITIISFGRDLFPSDPLKGTGQVHRLKTLPDAFDIAARSGRDRLYLVNDGYTGGEIDRLLGRFEEMATGASERMAIHRVENRDVLAQECESSSRGTTTCFAAIVMRGSPTEGVGGCWNYSIVTDASLTGYGGSGVDRTDNVPQVYFMPVQLALEALIATIDDDEPPSSADLDGFAATDEYPFTYQTQEEFDEFGYSTFYGLIIYLMAVVYLVPMVVAAFHLTGFIAGERESGMSHLIDTMSVTPQPWVSQVARMTANYLSFVLVYAPSWIVTAVTMRLGLFVKANFGVVLAVQLLGGLAMCSWALLFGSFFKKSQWSGITALVVAVGWGVMAQMFPEPSTVQAMSLSAIFAPSCYVNWIRILASMEMMPEYPSLSDNIDMYGWYVVPNAMFVFFVGQIFLYAILAFFIERLLHGTSSASRKVLTGPVAADTLGDAAVKLEGFSKIYPPGMSCRRRKKPIVAVENLDFTAQRGQIVALLGANGSGKSTTLDSIGGLRKLTSGSITIDGTGGIGIAPQKNVLWDNLTVEEHLNIFTQLKTADPEKLKDKAALKVELDQLLDSIGLLPKRNALAKTLSGGQKRKLQLGMMLTGGSAVCCVDEVSTGIDPLSRRNIWDILMAERGQRTLILTTHFLDEADMLADHIAILSKGTLRAQGSSVELKDTLGGGYRVFVPRTSMKPEMPAFEDVESKPSSDSCTYITPSSELAAKVIRKLEELNVTDYRVSNPTLEDVFLQLAEEIDDQEAFRVTQRDGTEGETTKEKNVDDDAMSDVHSDQGPLELYDGRVISFLQQARILFVKRLLTLKKSWIPVAMAFVLPTVAGCLIMLLAVELDPINCVFSTNEAWTSENVPSILGNSYMNLIIGPPSRFSNETYLDLVGPITKAYPYWGDLDPVGEYRVVDTLDQLKETIDRDRLIVSAGIWLGDDSTTPTVAWAAGYDASSAMAALGIVNMFRANLTIASSITSFETVEHQESNWALQMIIYMTLVLLAYPPLLVLYQAGERRNRVRSMEYSNGVRPLSLWLAYLSFDFSIVLVVSVIAGAVWSSGGNAWYNPSYMVAVLIFYGTASVLLAHLISLGTRSQLATWAVSVIVQAVAFAVYFGATVAITGSSLPSLVDASLTGLYFGFAVIAPIMSWLKAIFVALNMYNLSCGKGELPASNPAGLMYYGGPILYLILQTIVFGALVIWIDGGFAGTSFQRLFGSSKGTDTVQDDETTAPEVVNAGSDEYGLRLQHVTKSFGSNTAVDNVSFGIERGEIFALLGPNGAGKSTIVSLICGDTKPSHRTGGDILVEDHSVLTDISAARSKLGVCPQFDALDLLTVRQHLDFYAKIRGIADYQHNVSAVLRAVGLEGFSSRMAHTLSGGNKRKLSLGIALIGNPAVLLLDEPSSGLDAASKRIMWQTLMHTSVGRSILLTTHSMEEADALAVKVGIISGRLLAADTPDGLRNRYSNILHVHLVCRSAPRTPPEEMQLVINWVRERFPHADIDDKTYHGQIRFSVRGADVLSATPGTVSSSEENVSEGTVGQLLLLLESVKADLGVAHYSVTPTTLDQVFLSIVRAHNGDEENQHAVKLSVLGKVGRVLWS